MGDAPFKERDLYYQYEDVYFEGQVQPVISTWIYLGKQILASESATENAVGYVFAFWDTEVTDLGWHATSVTQTFWTLEMAREKMLAWNDFKKLVLDLSSDPCPPCCQPRLMAADDWASRSIEDRYAGQATPFCADSAFAANSLHYQICLVAPRVIICKTHICIGQAESPGQYEDEQFGRAAYFTKALSRGLGIERFGQPELNINCEDSRWESWWKSLPESIDLFENFDERVREAKERSKRKT
jgi:hypothetical protein